MLVHDIDNLVQLTCDGHRVVSRQWLSTKFDFESDSSGMLHKILLEGDANRLLYVYNNKINTHRYKAGKGLTVDLVQCCDSLISFLSDRKNRSEVLRLYNASCFSNYLSILKKDLGEDITIGTTDYTPEDCDSAYIRFCVACGHTIPKDVFTVLIDLRYLTDNNSVFHENYEKYSILLSSFCDSFISNLPKWRRLSLMD